MKRASMITLNRQAGVFMKKMMKRIGIILAVLVVVMAGVFYIYTMDYYRASDYVDDIISNSTMRIEEDGKLTYIYPENPKSEGIIFYPGGKVEAIAYMPLLLQLAEEGYTTVLVEMPFNLAVFNVNGANKVLESNSEIDSWYLAGHSLGGAMASSYTEENYDRLEGLILLGSYPVNEAPIETLAIYGTYDVKLDLEKVRTADVVYEIVDGNHAWFGDYGEQEGDGQALISHEEQQAEAVEEIVDFIEGHNF